MKLYRKKIINAATFLFVTIRKKSILLCIKIIQSQSNYIKEKTGGKHLKEKNGGKLIYHLTGSRKIDFQICCKLFQRMSDPSDLVTKL